MTILATASDIETFVQERSPHVKNVDVIEKEDITVILIKLDFWYRFFYERTFYHYITNLIEENQMYGVKYDIVLTS